MTESKSAVRRDIEHAREQMTETLDELDAQVTERIAAVKQRLDVAQLVREHPWPALSVAVAIGAFVGGSGADEKAAAAAANAAKRAARASAEGAKRLAANVRRRDRESGASTSEASVPARQRDRGLGDRLFAVASAPLVGVIDRVLDEMRVASRDWGARLSGSRASAPTSTTVDLIVETRTAETTAAQAADVVPVPPEMMPTELDARADAVEALGGGTHEPPLEPGAGDLGARWA